ncbi:MAG: type I secretion protein TolC [Rhodanobacter sp. 68-29]|uniref:TolC family outer membrane protein n=1 Tax=Rhodanobacter sp. PCA2 TaxID=2006117 RepID=UPI00086D3124|nr:TolC family outer membrane protein [Rhodanobacter sp. PCA2]MBA2077149.1 type I secretion protein TolC [Rhodanobacter sp. PCA2]MBN8922944.1 TolC family outer membrane protein [Rhodanobacter sp.]ODU75425.1 MAG: type I secretion protein TolC [Rhodanobacter sp. SCN 69-32]OJY58650.1 MAG: type I secretion protein TolC [Rhodanobacter sp. 68-29]
MRLKLLTLALALAAVSLPSHGEDLLDAYREARANDPVLAQADATRLATGEGVNQARALLLPQISGDFSLSQTNGGGGGRVQDPNNPNQFISTSSFGHSRTRNLSANLSQTVFDFSKYANLKSAHASANAQDELYQAALQNLFVRVASAYFTVLTDQDQLAFAKANEDAYKRQFEQSDQRYKVGLSAVTDVYQAKSYYEAAKAQTIAAQNTLDNDREALSQITGKPTGNLKKLRDELPMNAPDPADPDAWVKQALINNPSLLAQQQNVRAADANVTAARSGHLPTISANVSYGKSASWYQNAAIHSNTPSQTTVGLTLSVPIFSGGMTQSKVRQSIYNRDAAQDSEEIERRQVRANTLNYYRSVLAGVSQVQSGKAAVDSAQKALDATRAGFEVGTQTMVNVLLAIQVLTQAESTYSQSRHQLVLNRLLLKQSAGTASLDDLQGINALLQ